MGAEADENKGTLITIGEAPPAPKAWEFEVLEDHSAYEEKGNVVEVEGAEFYITGEGSGCGLLIMSDYWGYNSGRVRVIADHLSQSCNSLVAIPKLLSEPPLQGGTDGDGVPPEYDPEADPAELKKWLMLYLWETFESKIKTVAQHLRKNGVKRIGGIGLSYGAWTICYTSVLCKDMMGAVLVSPLAGEIEEMNGGDPYIIATRITCPCLFMPSRKCMRTYHPGGEMYDAVKIRHDLAACEPFLQMDPDWLVRGDASVPGVKDAIAQSVMEIQKFLRRRIWPLPLGADADTLRQACQDDDADRVEELIKLQIPVCGKDALDVAGMSPIHYAARFGCVQPIKLLVEAQAEVNASGGAMQETALHCAARSGRNKASATLLQLGAEVDNQDLARQTPLHHASLKGHLGVCKILLAGKAQLEEIDTAGQTPLHIAAWHSRNELVRYYITLRCNIDTEDLRGQTAFARATQAGCTEVSDQLDLERERREEEELQRQQAEAAEKEKEKAAEKGKEEKRRASNSKRGSTNERSSVISPKG
jgi:dienelactone hydrolase